MKPILYALPFVLLMIGCGGDTNQRPYIAGQKPKSPVYTTTRVDPAIKIATIEAESRKEVAQIQMQRDLELERLKKEAKSEEVTALKEIEIKKQETISQQEANLNSRYNTIVILGSLFLLTAMGLLIYFLIKRREDTLKIHHDTLEQEMALKEKELQVQMATKILDTIASGTLDKEDEKRLIETFEKSNRTLPYKKKY